MTENHRQGKDGVLEDDVGTYAASARQMQTFENASRALGGFSAPIMRHASDRNEYLYIAAFDGTGNDAERDPAHKTNIGLMVDQVAEYRQQGGANLNVQAQYEFGVGTRGNAVEKVVDLATGYSYDKRLEDLYSSFCAQARDWLKENPKAQIRVADIGFSRGAEQAAGFARLVHERGIMDPDSRRMHRDERGNMVVEYSRNLVAPGTVAQSVGLFDPVGTGEPRNHDRRLPPSVLSAFQLTAEDERRNLFKSTRILDPGITEDGRFLNVMVAGAHSDLGGGYHRNGLSIRSGNLMIDYLNALSDQPFLHKSPVPDDPRLNVVHRSEEGLLLYRVLPKVDRGKPEGYVDELAPASVCRTTDCRNAEPVDKVMDARFDRHRVQIGGVPLQLPDAAHAHPQQAAYTRIADGVDAMTAKPGSGLVGDVGNLSAGLLLNYERSRYGLGMTNIDHVLLGQSVGSTGPNAFLIQGGLNDPAQRRLAVSAAELAAQPAGASFKQLDAFNRERDRQSAQAGNTQEPQKTQVETAPAMSR
ncbi:MAG: DUF2235 domain-containing protein [Proteobacteria bacterium]|nr:DUF2235 domain-containing protein [Pseudomonadota bacterium]MBS0218367.1 DUF2235 domain-containing protein [Pseudomonadota bacterium]